MIFTKHGFQRLSEFEPYWPGFTKLWETVRDECDVARDVMGAVTFSDEPTVVDVDYFDGCRRFTVDLATNEIVREGDNSCGRWDALPAIAPGTAVVTCKWSDCYRTLTMTVNVAAGTLKAPLPAHMVA